MIKEKILTKAWEAGLIYKQDNTWLFDRHSYPSESILLFAEELILAEREACAKLCDDLDAQEWSEVGEYTSGYGDKIRKQGIQ